MAFIPNPFRYFLPFGLKRRGPKRTEVSPPNGETPDPSLATRREAMQIPEEKRRLAERRRARKASKGRGG